MSKRADYSQRTSHVDKDDDDAPRPHMSVPQAVWDPAVELEDCQTPWWSVEALKTVVLQHNRIKTLPPAFCCLEELNVLNLSSNAVSHLPEEISGLVDLRSLVLSKNRLEKLPESVATLTALVRLECSDNPGLATLPAALGRSQRGLAAVVAERCALAAFPAGLAHARSLRVLTLAGNALPSIPPNAFAAATGLTELDLSGNRLETLPEDLLRPCGSLVTLTFASNRLQPSTPDCCATAVLSTVTEKRERKELLQEMPGSLSACTSLATLDISSNRFRVLPHALRACCALAELSVHDNRLSGLGDAVLALPALRLLDLRNNDLATLPAGLGHVTTLRAVPLVGNPMRSIPRAVREGPVSRLLEHLRMQEPAAGAATPVGAPAPDRSGDSAGAALSQGLSGSDLARRAANQLSLQSRAEAQAAEEGTRVFVHGPGGSMHEHKGVGSGGGKEIRVAGLGLKELPEEVFAVGDAATFLDASRNALEQLPGTALAALRSLTAIDLSRNLLRSWPLPQGRGDLPDLVRLQLCGNRTLPPLPPGALACCAGSLTLLDLSGCNRVGQDISAVSACMELQALRLDTCGLTEFPAAAVSGLSSLTQLCLDNNAIPALPMPPLAALPALEELAVRNNELTALPPQLALLPRLRTLSVDGNMLRTIRRSILDRGSPALLEYLHSRLPM